MYATRDVELTPAAPAEWLNLTDAKAFLGITGATYDAVIQAILTAAHAAIESYCNRPIAQRSVTETVWTEEAHGTFVLAVPNVTALASLSYGDEAQTVGDYTVLKSSGMLRHSEGATFGAGKWTFAYTAGYATVPAPIVHATKELVRELFNTRNKRGDVTRESVTDVGDVQFSNGETYYSTGPSGQRLPVPVAANLEHYVMRLTT